MSSILKALKKVERKSPRKEESTTLLEKIDTNKAINRRVKGVWLVNRILFVLMVILILGIGSWFLWTYRGPLAERLASKSPATKPADKALVEPVRAEKKAPEPDANKEQVMEETPDVNLTPEEAFPSTQNDTAPPQVVKPSEQPEDSAAGGPASDMPQGVGVTKPIDANRYKLEAIVWSNNPESRFAVVNGQIVRSGTSLEGLSVTEIGRDHVAVRSKKSEWKLRFTVE